MANTLKFKRGLVAGIPTAALGEPLFTTDTFDLYIGNGTGNTRFQKYIASGTTSQLLRGDGSLLTMPIVLTSPANGEVLKYNGTNWVNSSDAGITGSGVAGQVAYFTGATTQGGSNNLFWDSANNRLGLGNNAPTRTLDVSGTARIYGNLLLQSNFNSDITLNLLQTGKVDWYFTNKGATGNLVIGNGNGDMVSVTTSGNLGLGVVPSAWQSVYRSIDIGNASLFTAPANTEVFVLCSNAFLNSAGAWVYKNTGTANLFEIQSGGGFRWRLAPSGSAGGTPTFTQPMTLTANGRLLLGTTTEGTQRLQVAGDVKFDADAATNGFYWDNTNKRLGIGTNAPRTRVGIELSGATAPSTVVNTTGFDNTYTTFGNVDLVSGSQFAIGVSQTGTTGTYLISAAPTSEWTDISYYGRSNIFFGGGTERMRIDANGSVGIGTTSLTGIGLSVSKTITGATSAYGILNNGVIQSDVTSSANYFMSSASSQNTVFTLTALYHFRATGGSAFGSATVSNQIGFNVGSSLTGATNNYGFYGDLASGTGRWNLYMNGTANNYLAGSVGIGTSADLTFTSLRINKLISGASISYSILNGGQIQSTVSSVAYYNRTLASTQATTFTLNALVHYAANQSTLGAGSTVTNQYGYIADPTLIGATNNYGFYGEIPSGTGRWNLYMIGTAANYMAGSLSIGTTTTSSARLHVISTETRTIYAQNQLSTGNVQGIVSESLTTNTGYNAAFLANAANGAGGNYSFYGFAGTIYNAGNLLLGSLTDSGEKLQVTGTMKVTGASTFGGAMTLSLNQNAATTFTISNTNATQYSEAHLQLTSSAAAGFGRVGKYSSSTDAYKIVTASNTYLYNTTAGDIAILNDFASGSIKLAAGGSSTAHFTIASTGAATFSSSVTAQTGLFGGNLGAANQRVANFRNSGGNGYIELQSSGAGAVALWAASGNEFAIYQNATAGTIGTNVFHITSTANVGISTFTPAYKLDVNGTFGATGAATFSSSIQAATAIAIGTTPDTNKPFKILKSINGTVGINFENTSTGASAFSAIQMGTDVSGGTAFTNLVYSSSGVTAAGVYQPSGTSLINTGSGGLNFLSVSQPIRFFTSTGNGTERVRIKNEGQVHFVPLAAAPTTSVQAGDVYYDSTLAKLRCYDGIQWQDLF